ncbi:MAG TPA: hypothetical protein DCQ36_11510 [Actinobacteria bacterium]|jgi:hypothetical protein|nr:hypothetical protein [Actinomycetota bacterium]
MTTPAAQIDRLIHTGEVIAREGIPAADVDLLLLAHDARDLGVEPILIDVMVDEDAPAVVRIRAFARVSSAMAHLVVKADRRPVTDAAPRRELAATARTPH